MTYFAFRKGKRTRIEYEYFCFSCGQLRLSFVEEDTCGNCGSNQIRKAVVGALDKAACKKERRSTR